MRVRVEKKTAQQKLIDQKSKNVDWLRLDKKMQPIPRTEWPTGALVGAGALWPNILRTKLKLPSTPLTACRTFTNSLQPFKVHVVSCLFSCNLHTNLVPVSSNQVRRASGVWNIKPCLTRIAISTYNWTKLINSMSLKYSKGGKTMCTSYV